MQKGAITFLVNIVNINSRMSIQEIENKMIFEEFFIFIKNHG